jgi:hypothetical protein
MYHISYRRTWKDCGGRRVGVTCITIIDTIIQTNYTNDAYLHDTYTEAGAKGTSNSMGLGGMGGMGLGMGGSAGSGAQMAQHR